MNLTAVDSSREIGGRRHQDIMSLRKREAHASGFHEVCRSCALPFKVWCGRQARCGQTVGHPREFEHDHSLRGFFFLLFALFFCKRFLQTQHAIYHSETARKKLSANFLRLAASLLFRPLVWCGVLSAAKWSDEFRGRGVGTKTGFF